MENEFWVMTTHTVYNHLKNSNTQAFVCFMTTSTVIAKTKVCHMNSVTLTNYWPIFFKKQTVY